ncbi:MAG: hypothetical protein WC208_15575 [Gallionella sp.]|jgi:hypothetical protein
MRVFLVNENNELAKSLIKKLEGAKHGQIIMVSPEELKFYKGGNLIALDLPEDIAKTAITVQASLPKNANVVKPTEGQKLPGTAPKSPASE